jgi:hypothetical protein
VWKKEFKSLIFEINIDDPKEETTKQMNGVTHFKTWIRNSPKRWIFREKYGNLGSENLNESDAFLVESITNRLDQAEERISGVEDKVEELLHLDK